jgi:hypothetical protein
MEGLLMKNIEDDGWDGIYLPMVKNIHSGSLRYGIKGMTSEEVRNEMKRMFDKFEKETGFKPVVVGGKTPISVVVPKEHINNEN